MHLHFTKEKPLESIFVLQSLAHLPCSSVSQKSFVNTHTQAPVQIAHLDHIIFTVLW